MFISARERREVNCLCDIMFECMCELKSKTRTRAVSDTIKSVEQRAVTYSE